MLIIATGCSINRRLLQSVYRFFPENIISFKAFRSFSSSIASTTTAIVIIPRTFSPMIPSDIKLLISILNPPDFLYVHFFFSSPEVFFGSSLPARTDVPTAMMVIIITNNTIKDMIMPSIFSFSDSLCFIYIPFFMVSAGL